MCMIQRLIGARFSAATAATGIFLSMAVPAFCRQDLLARRPISPAAQQPISPKVLVLNFDPSIKSEGGKRLHEVAKWNDPHYLAAAYAADLQECSGNFVRYRIVLWQDVDTFPVKKDGFRYTEEEYLKCMREGKG